MVGGLSPSDFASFTGSNEARGLIGLQQPTLVAPVGRHPLMAADNRGASRATGARAGRIRGLSRWGLPPRPSQLPTCGFNVHNEDSEEARPSSPTAPNKDERLLLDQKCSLIGGQLRRDPSLTFQVCLMARDGKVRFQMSGVELHSRDAAGTGVES